MGLKRELHMKLTLSPKEQMVEIFLSQGLCTRTASQVERRPLAYITGSQQFFEDVPTVMFQIILG